MLPITYQELLQGSKVFVSNEERDAVYKVATYIVNKFWGNPRDTTDGLGVFLLSWNQALYRYGSFDFNALEKCLIANSTTLQQFRQRDIFSYSENDKNAVTGLFNELLEALKTPNGSHSPVAVAKALHLLAPNFFPLWDNKIAKGYGSFWDWSDVSSQNYLDFMGKTLHVAEETVQSYMRAKGAD